MRQQLQAFDVGGTLAAHSAALRERRFQLGLPKRLAIAAIEKMLRFPPLFALARDSARKRIAEARSSLPLAHFKARGHVTPPACLPFCLYACPHLVPTLATNCRHPFRP